MLSSILGLAFFLALTDARTIVAQITPFPILGMFALVGCTPNRVTKFKYTWLRVFVPTLLTGVSVAVYYDKC